MIDLRQIQADHKKWQDQNFPGWEPWECLVGAQEELGELCHAFLKGHQGIRGKNLDDEVFPDEARDAIGDTIVFLMGLCNAYGWDLENILETTWQDVSQRRWR